MSVFTLAFSWLAPSNLPYLMGLTFQVPMQYCSLQHWTVLSPPDTYTAEPHFHFGPASSFFLKLLVVALRSSPVAYWTAFCPWAGHLLVSYPFAFSCASWVSCGKNTGAIRHSLLQGTVFCQNSPP